MDDNQNEFDNECLGEHVGNCQNVISTTTRFKIRRLDGNCSHCKHSGQLLPGLEVNHLTAILLPLA